ncbi:MAG: heavy metal translocating P-type ATPase, partial [Gammaproteobacteria bacterium]|nr:heavy metal translocating P-type ATPase [Gammaproteobacteria bacterium]
MTNLLLVVISATALAVGVGLAWLDQGAAARWVWAGGALPSLAMLVRETLRSLRRREAGVDLLALLSISGAIVLEEQLTSVVIALMLASGRALESFAQGRASREMSALLARAPRTANLCKHGEIIRVSIDQVAPGDHLLVRSGDTVPVDGLVVSKLAVLDESPLTGESKPVERHEGERICSGALNAGAPFELRATVTAADSTYAGIVRLVSAAQASKAPASRLADRYALWFVPLSLSVATLAWLASGDPMRALAVLVVATPCPLILAVPVAIVSAMSSCARRGVLIKNGGALEQLAQAKILFFDKTGTLTTGNARLVSITSGSGVEQQEVLRLAASLDQLSGHVIATAVVAAARERGMSLSMPTDIREEGGAGITGIIDGRTVNVGAYDFVSVFAPAPEWAATFLEDVAEEGGAAVFVAVNGQFVGALHLADQLRLDTPRAVRLLRRAGIQRILMLT